MSPSIPETTVFSLPSQVNNFQVLTYCFAVPLHPKFWDFFFRTFFKPDLTFDEDPVCLQVWHVFVVFACYLTGPFVLRTYVMLQLQEIFLSFPFILFPLSLLPLKEDLLEYETSLSHLISLSFCSISITFHGI